MTKIKLALQCIWEITVSLVLNLFEKDEVTENEQWLKERMDYAKSQKQHRTYR